MNNNNNNIKRGIDLQKTSNLRENPYIRNNVSPAQININTNNNVSPLKIKSGFQQVSKSPIQFISQTNKSQSLIPQQQQQQLQQQSKILFQNQTNIPLYSQIPQIINTNQTTPQNQIYYQQQQQQYLVQQQQTVSVYPKQLIQQQQENNNIQRQQTPNKQIIIQNGNQVITPTKQKIMAGYSPFKQQSDIVIVNKQNTPQNIQNGNNFYLERSISNNKVQNQPTNIQKYQSVALNYQNNEIISNDYQIQQQEILKLKLELKEKQDQIQKLSQTQNKTQEYIKDKLSEVHNVNDELEDKFQQMVSIIDEKENEIQSQKQIIVKLQNALNNNAINMSFENKIIQDNNQLKAIYSKHLLIIIENIRLTQQSTIMNNQINQLTKENNNYKNQYSYDQEIIDQLQSQLNMMKEQDKDRKQNLDKQLNQNSSSQKSMNNLLTRFENENLQLRNENKELQQAIQIYKNQLNQDQSYQALLEEKKQKEFEYQFKFQKQENLLQQYLDRINYLEDQAGELAQELKLNKASTQGTKDTGNN